MRISLTTLLLFLVIILHAQTYSGRVADKDGSPLAGANVTGVNQEGRIACYALADAEGRFRITVPEGKAVTAFSFSYIGYTKRTIPIAEMKEGMTVRLSVGEVKLKEVKVTGQRIKAAGDTLIYSVNAFRHEQDRTIADVLKKMPGIEVKSGGTIEYQGVPITELKIEGMNLMGRQYAMASNNLSAKKVKSVQVLRNHQPVRSLRGVKFSDDTALNLILTDDARGEWITSADLSLGLSLPDSHDDGDTRLLYDCRLISMCFAHKYQTLMMYKSNSTGKDISLELQDVASMRRPQPHEGGLTHLMGEPSARVGRERHTFNDTHILAANGLAKLSETQQLRLQASLLSDKHESLSSTSTTYLTLDDMPVVMEQVDITNRYSVLKAELNYEYNSPSTYLRSNTRGYADWNKSEGITTVNQSTSERLVKPRKRYISEDIELSHTSKSGHVTSFSSYTTYDYLPSQLLTINDLWQNLTLKSLTTNNEVQQKIRVAGQYMNARMGINHTTLDIDISMSGDGTGQETHTAEKRRHQTTDLYLHPSFSLALGSHDIEAGVRLSFMHQTYSEATADDFTACPLVAWTWRPTLMTKLRLRYTYAAQARQSAAIYDTPIFTNYRNVTVNAGTPDVQRTQQLSAAFEFNSPIKGLFF
ncbi:MAG: carboxypeptidase regulatory-like domain-containing protein, partial [Prevotella sp.]